ncbi:MAG: cysteine--tRNA ligase [Thermodesulfobacteriota bacterium]
MITVYNSMTRKKEEFKTIKPGVVNMYVCGPTVYSLSHIGHARSAVAFDVIFKYLLYSGLHVRYARNYTDVDDKIINRANEEGLDPEALALENIKAFDEDMAGLGVALPTYRPRATESIGIIITLIETLIERGHAYAIDSDVYFSVRSFEDYGKLSGKNIDDLESGARVEVDDRKKDPLDFALWKGAKPGEPSWPSPWGDGEGRPGWHIECSAMSQCFLGETLDIHGGGKDLIFPHHENEIAQSEASTGKEFVRYWLHNGFVNIDKEKMSKSLGNILNIRDVLKEFSREAVRLFLLSNHYRSPIDYSRESLTEATAALERFYRTLKRMEDDYTLSSEVEDAALKERLAPILDAMNDDFNTAIAIGRVFEEVGEANRLMDSAKKNGTELVTELSLIRALFKEASGFLGIFDRSAAEFFDEVKEGAGVDAEVIEGLIVERKKARDDKDFKRADEIRDELKAKGIILEDTAKGTSWTVE